MLVVELKARSQYALAAAMEGMIQKGWLVDGHRVRKKYRALTEVWIIKMKKEG